MTLNGIHHVMVPLHNGYMQYVESPPVYSREAGAMIHPSHYVATIDYSEVVDACLDDLKEHAYL